MILNSNYVKKIFTVAENKESIILDKRINPPDAVTIVFCHTLMIRKLGFKEYREVKEKA